MCIACSKDEHDRMMREIEGEYELTSTSIRDIPEEDFQLIKNARIYKIKDKWVFDYILARVYKDGSNKIEQTLYHNMVQEVEWNNTVKKYLFHTITERDVENTLYKAEEFYVSEDNNQITLKYTLNEKLSETFKWTKIK